MQCLPRLLLWFLWTIAWSEATASLHSIITSGWNLYEATELETRSVNGLKEQMILVDQVDENSLEFVSKYAALLDLGELRRLQNYAMGINTYYNLMMQYTRSDHPSLPVDFAKTVINDGSVLNLTAKVHRFFFDRRQYSLISEVALALRNYPVCELRESPSQILTQLAAVFAGAVIKGQALVQFSYSLLDGDYAQEQMTRRHEFNQQLYKMIASSKEIIGAAPGELWTCDPKTHVEGETFVQFTKFMQGYIQHETFLNKDHTCAGGCSGYDDTRVYHRKDKKIDDFSAEQTCFGKVVRCQDLSSDVTVCSSKSPNRRYDFIRYENNVVLGRRKRCSYSEVDLSSWLALVIIGYRCSYCFCFCEEELSDRFISMRTARSDITANRVVTGMRFVKDKCLIKIQVQEGQLMKHGLIDEDTVRWVPVKNFSRLSEGVYLNQDYYKLTMQTNVLHLDDVIANPGHVVTGVRFKMLGSNLVLEILNSPYDFDAGKLTEPYQRSFWTDNIVKDVNVSHVDDFREQIRLGKADIPTMEGPPHVYMNNPKQSVSFTSTDVDADLAQTTIPFIDAQPVFSGIPTPLKGLGIHYRGRRGSGGFVAPKIITYNYSERLPNKGGGR